MPFSADDYITAFEEAAEANQDDALRRGNRVVFEDTGRLVATGDLHGHRRNFEKIVKFAQLDAARTHHVILHEMIHGGPDDGKGGDLSFEMLFQAAKLKVRYPNQVHLLLGNHDLAQMTGQELSRSGMPRCVEAFNKGLAGAFGPRAKDVAKAMYAFLRSQPLGAVAGKIFFSHSTPARRTILDFDYTVFDRPLTPADLEHGGSAYNLVWGRNYEQAIADSFARRLNVELFVIGHESQPEGFGTPTNRHVILASDHGHGVCLPITLGKPYTHAELVKSIKKLAAMA